MRKLLIFLAAIVLCAGCENYQADIDTYLSYWATEAAIVRSSFNPAITVQTDTDTIQSIPSSSDVTVTFTVRNPKNFTFQLPGDAGAPTDIIVFPTDVAGTTTSSPKQPDDYELTQDSYSQLTLTYKKEFLQKHEYGKKNIGPTITLYAKDGRKFSETFKINVKANTPPPNLTYRAIGKTAVPDGSGQHYYVLFLEVPDMYREINSSELLHKDIKYLSIAEGSGSYTSIPLTVKADKSGFDISGTGGRLLEASATGQLATADVESDVTPDPLPASTEKWIIRIKTDVEVRGAVKQYRFRLQDEAGLFSEDELVASTSTNKVSPVLIAVQTGNWTTTTKSGSETDPHEIVYDPRVQKVVLQASTATTGATVEYKLERNSSVVSKSSGQTPQTIELPAVPDAVYKLTVWAEKEGYDKSSDVVVYYKTKRNNTLEISAGQNAWKQLKAAVAAVEDGDVISINGTIKATNADGNNGAIEITKKVTIKGNDATIDMLDANKDELSTSAHRIFTIKNGGELILEKLTLKNGKAAGTGNQGRGGAMLIESGGTLTMTDCIVQECIAANSGGGIDNKGILTINGGMVGSITAGSGNHASMGGGIFLDQGSCTLNGVAVQKNTIGTGIINRGPGIYLSKPSSGSAALTITGRTQIGDNTTGSNTLCLGARSASQSAFVTAKDLAIGSYINIEPQNYGAQKNTTLVKLPNGYAAAYNYYFHLTEAGSQAEDWVLISNDDDKELVLKKGTAIAGGGSGAWKHLKDAITEAEVGDTIVVDGEITASTLSGNYGEISVTKSITIRGNKGRAYDILDANKGELGANAHRIFNVTGSGTKLTLENITLQNGKAAGGGDNGMGGGIFCKNIKELTIKGCVIMDCEADIEGGGICVAASGGVNTKAVITETIISRNTAGLRGGGIAFNPSNVTSHITGVLDNITVESNSLTSMAPNTNNGGAGIYFGGGYNDNSEYTVKGGSVKDNNAGIFSGGGAYIKTNTSGSVNGTLTLTDGARISGNSATNGGGIAVRSAKLIIESGCTIGGEQDYNGVDPDKAKGNTAKTSGGGIYIGEKGECTTEANVAIRYNTVTNGIAVMDGGGGLYIKEDGTVTITGTKDKPVIIEDNKANISTNNGIGGGIANNGTITLTHARISSCESSGIGGGIFVRNGQCTLIHSEVSACVAQGAGGGVYVYKDAVVGGRFTMQGSSRIVLSSDNEKGKNDIFLKKDNGETYITLSGKLTSTTPVGRITVPDTNYNLSTKVLDGDITVDDNYKKFTVTPKSGQNWYINTAGKLTTTAPSP
ncbi:hypothetical protein [Treponema sp. OMZ 857]|uniref:hypothetical protein n=1 Tax=Treponema sp. OMZ 857 TaxID=1643513 RepID=UPI0020A31F2F|nr:hypothetical protein [Treponema sp. OMZ 857]UTC43164.1 hypothetical protein E4N66_03040 [Treponema sp. OMZ 857]